MRVSVCVGQYAQTPYFLPGLEISVYSVEELCICLKEQVYLLDSSLMCDELTGWIEKECGIRELAAQLYPLIHKKGSLSEFVSTILEYAGFYDDGVIRETEQILKQNAGYSVIEKRKNQIDRFVRKKKYVAALRGYDNLLEKWDELEREGEALPGARVLGAILHNKAVALSNLMLYGYSAESFLQAYEADGNEEHFQAYLAAKRMELDEGAYISFAAGQVKNYEQTLALEKRWESLDEDWKLQPEYQRMLERKSWHDVDRQKYYEENDAQIQALKNAYRNSVSE